MNYRSVGDMAACIAENLHRIPRDLDLVVGIPRSGMLAASMIALALNLPLADIATFLAKRSYARGKTRLPNTGHATNQNPRRRVLIVDDSIYSGGSLEEVRQQVETSVVDVEVIYCVIYGTKTGAKNIDICFEEVSVPRMFEWNVMHHPLLEHCCVDIDGVLCVDPNHSQNDDGMEYQKFLASPMPKFIPTVPVGYLVTSRLEKYRRETETWLASVGIRYKKLFLLDLPDAATRRRVGAHATFKAAIYRQCHDAMLFIESEDEQARKIFELSGLPVLSLGAQSLYRPGKQSPVALARQGRRLTWKAIRRLRRAF